MKKKIDLNVKENHEKERTFLKKIKLDLLEIYSKSFISHSVYILCLHLIKKWLKNKVPYEKYYLPYSIYFACCKENFPLTLKEISDFFGISIKKFCQLEKILPVENKIPPFSFIEKYGSNFNLNFSHCKKINELVKLFQNNFSTNLNIAIGVALLKAGLNLDESKVCQVLQVNKYTLRKYQKLFSNFST